MAGVGLYYGWARCEDYAKLQSIISLHHCLMRGPSLASDHATVTTAVRCLVSRHQPAAVVGKVYHVVVVVVIIVVVEEGQAVIIVIVEEVVARSHIHHGGPTHCPTLCLWPGQAGPGRIARGPPGCVIN